MNLSRTKSVSIRMPGARAAATLALAAVVAGGAAVGWTSLGGSATPTVAAQEAPVAAATPEAEPVAATPATAPVDVTTVAAPVPIATDPEATVAAQAAPSFASNELVVVDADGLNFRAAPGLAGDVAAVLPAGATATVVAGPTVADTYIWYQLDVNGVTGWSAGEFLAPAGTTLAFAAQIPQVALYPVGTAVQVADGPLTRRAAAGLAGAIPDELATGPAATVLAGPTAADGYTWYRLDVAGVSGWSAGEFLAPA
jgi:hypothetical protein